MSPLEAIAVAALMSTVLVGAVRQYAIRYGILDQPNKRSSHVTATPRGGGAGLLAATLVSFALMAPKPSSMDWRLLIAFFGTLLTAIVGWVDDRRGIAIALRLTVHIASGVLLLPLVLTSREWTVLSIVAGLYWVFAATAAINVINFIDGIDGLIGLQGVVFGLQLATLGNSNAIGTALGAVMAGACLGFLFWNWAPARIFMGDVGSGPLGLIWIIGGILVWQQGEWSLVAIFLPALPIFLDASVTMLRRAWAGEQIYIAHRLHLYQRLANGGWGHAPVALLYGAAAGLGALFAHITPQWPVIVALYIGILIVVGIVLDRRVPFRIIRSDVKPHSSCNQDRTIQPLG